MYRNETNDKREAYKKRMEAKSGTSLNRPFNESSKGLSDEQWEERIKAMNNTFGNYN